MQERPLNLIKEEMSFKDFLLKIYSDLDNLKEEELQKEIDNIKKELQEVIDQYQRFIDEKERQALERLASKENISKGFAIYHVKTTPEKIEDAQLENNENTNVKTYEIVILASLMIFTVIFAIILACL